MHLPDHYLDPVTTATTALLAGGAVSYALVRIRSEPAQKMLSAAAVGTAIFAAQMINFPIDSGTSGHLIGGALAGILLGPWAGLLTMTVVLAVQAVVFGDGGILALGANILNMGVISVGIGALARRTIQLSACHWLCQCFSAAIASWLSVIAAAFACALELAVSGVAPAVEVVPVMLSTHALIGIGEAGITALVVAVAYGTLPVPRRTHTAFLLAAIIIAALSPFASQLPDGLESVADSLTLNTHNVAPLPSLLSDYAIPGISWQPAATVLAGLIGVALVYSLALPLCRVRDQRVQQ
jgi:cobalt/nickel transport system permease protein